MRISAWTILRSTGLVRSSASAAAAAELTGLGVERLVQWTEGKKPVRHVVEVNRFTQEAEKGSRAPTPEEVKTNPQVISAYLGKER